MPAHLNTDAAAHPPVFCALDTPDLDRACTLAAQVGPILGGIKLGLEFFSAQGLDGLAKVCAAAPSAALFVDLKYHDIPNTVAGAVSAISHALRPMYLNVHASGGLAMLTAAQKACHPDSKLLAVTMLTSLDETAMLELGYPGIVMDHVIRLAKLSQQAGLNGVVCSAHEIEAVRKACGPDFTLMVPGIRPAGAASADQKRTMTPPEARSKGATHLVIGRPVTHAPDPAAAARAIIDSLT